MGACTLQADVVVWAQIEYEKPLGFGGARGTAKPGGGLAGNSIPEMQPPVKSAGGFCVWGISGMANTVFILGAGASKRGGAPLMMEFLDAAYDLLTVGRISDAEKESFMAVFEARSHLQRVHSKSNLDIHNIESVFAAFEMANILKRLGDYTPEQIRELLGAMKTIIASTIEKTLRFPLRGTHAVAPRPYRSFVNLVWNLRHAAVPRQTVAVITFNYDMAVDYAFNQLNTPVEYGLEDEPVNNAIPLLKLHGSLNWAWCSECEVVVPCTLPEYFSTWERGYEDMTESVMISMRNVLTRCAHGKHPVDLEPVIVPPTWYKSDYYGTLSPVWARAALELSAAENIFVIGYSLPPSDLFFRYLYALGTVSETVLKHFWVFNPDASVHERFQTLLGLGAQQQFHAFTSTFSDSIQEIEKAFRFDPRIYHEFMH